MGADANKLLDEVCAFWDFGNESESEGWGNAAFFSGGSQRVGDDAATR